jgi:hypothetical protein
MERRCLLAERNLVDPTSRRDGKEKDKKSDKCAGGG